MKRKFIVTGMTCSACSAHVEKAVKGTEGVRDASVNLLTGSMTAEFDEAVTDADKIIAAVVKAGYGAALDEAGEATVKRQGNARADARVKEQKEMRTRLILSVVFLLILMYVAMGHMVGAPLPSFLTGAENAVSYALLQLILCLPILYFNRAYFINGFKRLFKLSPNMDSLIAVGSTASLLYGLFVIFRMSYALGQGDMAVVEGYMHDLYFESAGMIPALVTVGKYLETLSKRRTGDALDKLKDLAPPTAIVLEGGEEIEKDSSELLPGDIVVVKAGASVPADAVVLSGHAFVDESAVSGESVPVEKTEGSELIGGTVEELRMADYKFPASTKSNLMDFLGPLARPAERLCKKALSQTPRIDGAKCVGCGICAKSCPGQAIAMTAPGKKARISQKACIHCYCCHELCPQKAVELHQSWLGRLLTK